MFRFILKRILYGALVMVGVVILVFVLFNLVNVDPARLTLGQRADVASVEKIRKDLGLDLPYFTRLGHYLNDVSPFSFHRTDSTHHRYLDNEKYSYTQLFTIGGETFVVKKPYLRRSYQTRREIGDLLMERIPSTAILAITAMFLATLVGIFVGIAAAVNQNSVIDRACIAGSVIGISSPSFFSGVVFQLLFAVILGGITGLNISGGLSAVDVYTGEQYWDWKNLILPALVLGIRPVAVIAQLTRSSMLDVLSMDYIRTAHAKGLNRYAVRYKHALRNALNPVLTSVSGWLASLFAGSFYVEYIFNFNGLGATTVDALKTFDFPVVMGAVLFIAFMFVIINVFVDILYSVLDPRISWKGGS